MNKHHDWCRLTTEDYNHPKCCCPIEEPIKNPLKFEDWFTIMEEDLIIVFAETGADREMDFDSEKEFEQRYEKYLDDPRFIK